MTIADIVKREQSSVEPFDLFDRLFEDWTRLMPFRRPWLFGREHGEGMIPVEEYKKDDALVIKAELPGIDPDKDVEISIDNGMLHIRAERHEEEEKEEKGFRRRELRYGSFSRTLPLPAGVKESDVTASYENGMLEISVPTPKTAATKVQIAKK